MLKYLFFSEFDVHKGPIISFIYPQIDKTFENKIEQEFECFKDLFIPTTELCFKPSAIEFDNHTIIVSINIMEGYPIEIKNEIYERVKLVYNCCFVTVKVSNLHLDSFGHDESNSPIRSIGPSPSSFGTNYVGLQQSSPDDRFALEKACEKLAIYLMEFEQKEKIISNTDKRTILKDILITLFENLKINRTSTIRVFEEIICLDLLSSSHLGSLEFWKRQNRFKVPCMM